MCGIIGIYAADGVFNRRILTNGNTAMTHRGPDAFGEWWSLDGCLGLGHRRLSIIDLSAAGHQPMVSADDRFTIVFNGEIYNYAEIRESLQQHGHQFRSRSDTEVILEAYRKWGVDCVLRLNGMFAFAVYDKMQRTIFLARDRAGEKPLFFFKKNGEFRFASELKALLADPALPRKMNLNALDCFLTTSYVPENHCILEGFNKLPAAHAMLLDLNSDSFRMWRYWETPQFQEELDEATQSQQELVSQLDALLERAVRRQLHADVPVGVLLSGGVDSSLLVAMAARNCPRVKTFNVSFPGYPELSEKEHARLIADHFGTDHTEIEASAASVEVIPKLARQFDEPMADSSMIPTFLLCETVHQQCTVALGGDGGDELFGGYKNYSRVLWMQQYLQRVPKHLRKIVSQCANRSMPIGMRGKVWASLLGIDFDSEYPVFSKHFEGKTRANLLRQSLELPSCGERYFQDLVPIGEDDLLQRATRTDFRGFLTEDILVKVDRASMLSSLEVRAPFLDRDVIDFAFGKVPSGLKATPYDRKILLKCLADDVLPASFDRKRKQGFSIPISAWLQHGEYREFFSDILLSVNGLFDSKVVKHLLNGQDHGCNNGERLFALLMLELWSKEYNVSI